MILIGTILVNVIKIAKNKLARLQIHEGRVTKRAKSGENCQANGSQHFAKKSIQQGRRRGRIEKVDQKTEKCQKFAHSRNVLQSRVTKENDFSVSRKRPERFGIQNGG